MTVDDIPLEGNCDPGFENVRDVFRRLLEQGENLGAGLVVFYNNVPVVQLFGGFADKEKTRPYTSKSKHVVFSSGKVPEAFSICQAISKGWIDWDTKIATIWPEFGAGNKENVTVKELLEHSGGVTWLDSDYKGEVNQLRTENLDKLAARIAGQPHNFGGVTTKAYHAITRGWFTNEILRRVRPDHKSMGEVYKEEINPAVGISWICGADEDLLNSSNFVFNVQSPAMIEQTKAFSQLMGPDSIFVKTIGLSEPSGIDDIDRSKVIADAARLTVRYSVRENGKLAKLANFLTNQNKGTQDGYQLMTEEVWRKAIQLEEERTDKPDLFLGDLVRTTHAGLMWSRPGARVPQLLPDMSTMPPINVIPEIGKGEGWEWVGWGGAGGSVISAAPWRNVAVGFTPDLLYPGVTGDMRGVELMAAVCSAIDALEKV
ncbi:hypothetical protein HDU93_007864 [Gonapodya sp. JEL0774]|nr:hypothetical protein HDU93_007864 [Gonapodya sp. JEL0774]